MAILQSSGAVKCASRVKTASTALAANSLVAYTSGRLVAATSSTLVFAGILQKAVTSSSDNYADAVEVAVVQPTLDTEFTMLCTGATASATTHVGVAYDLSDAVTLNLAGTTYKQFVVTDVIDSTHVKVKFNFAVVTIA